MFTANSGHFGVLKSGVKIYGSFYAFEQKFGVSRFFKVYVAEDGLHGAWIADRDCEFGAARMQAMGYGGGMAAGVVAGVAGRARQLEAQYDQDVPGSDIWTTRHKQNFSLRTGAIGRIEVAPNPRTAIRPNCYAILNLESNGSKRSFYLVGESDLATVRSLLGNIAHVEGNAASPFSSSPPPTPTPSPQVVPGLRAHKANQFSWIVASILSILTCAFFFRTSHSFFALIGLLLVHKFHGMIYNLYVMFNVNRDTAEQLEFNRRNARS